MIYPSSSKTPKILSSPQRDPSLLQDLKVVEENLRDYQQAIERIEDTVENLDRDDPMRLEGLRKLANFRLEVAREEVTVAILKARLGVVGNSWYNNDKGGPKYEA